MSDATHSRLPRRAARGSAALAAVMLAAAAVPAAAANVKDIYDFDVSDRQNFPAGQLTLGRNGILYGEDRNASSGAIFDITPGGKQTLLWSSGSYPNQALCTTGLTLGANGLLYGTCSIWNNNLAAGGAIFQFSPTKGLTVLYTYPSVNGQGSSANPSRLVQGTDGNLYGTAYSGNSGDANANGSVFRITPHGTYTTLYTFQGIGANDGSEPSALTLGSDGNFYGVTEAGGAAGAASAGTVFKITPGGAESILATFTNQTDGRTPVAALVQGNDGNFYGSTYAGGVNNQGTLFRMTPAGQITFLHDFSEVTDNGAYPTHPLTQGSDGALYAPAEGCSPSGCLSGNVFRLTVKGKYTTLYAFPPPCTNCEALPNGALLQDPSGAFYGVTQQGGAEASGTVYRLTVGAPALIGLQSPIGAAGSSLGIFGKGFTGATAVAFNGVSASFAVVSDTYLTATVPAGATAGFVSVTEPGATLNSAVVFTPQ